MVVVGIADADARCARKASLQEKETSLGVFPHISQDNAATGVDDDAPLLDGALSGTPVGMSSPSKSMPSICVAMATEAQVRSAK